MRYQVPQFIDVEDKIFGPFTLKQFIYMTGGLGLSFVVYVTLDSLVLAFIPIVIILTISAGLAFYKVYNHFPLVSVIEHAFKYYLGGKLYIWKKEDRPVQRTEENALKDAQNYSSILVPKISDSKLQDLTWSLDIKESLYSNKEQK